MYSSTCSKRPHAYNQELNNCSSSLWFYLRSVVTTVLLVVVGPVIFMWISEQRLVPYNRDGVCLLRGAKWDFEWNRLCFVLKWNILRLVLITLANCRWRAQYIKFFWTFMLYSFVATFAKRRAVYICTLETNKCHVDLQLSIPLLNLLAPEFYI
jgi:hypothetical protein